MILHFVITTCILLKTAEVYGGIICNPNFNCETCNHPYSCATCGQGTFFHRAGAYFECAQCDIGCVSCQYYADCQECVKGRHGEGCELFCSHGCLTGICEQFTGHCECKQFFMGNSCNECTLGRYGTNCDLKCSAGCLDETCDKTSGECVCKPGYTGLNCSECVQGRYGDDCQDECNVGCKQGVCNVQTGDCQCKENFQGDKCDRCIDYKYDIYSNCTLSCPDNCLKCESSARCTACKSGYSLKTCNQTRENCIDGNISCIPDKYPCGTEGKYGEHCTLNCMKHCKLCSSGELCDLCKTGYWSSNCQQTCPENCKNGVCAFYDGTCEAGCKSGYRGKHCEEHSNNLARINKNNFHSVFSTIVLMFILIQ